MAGFFIPEFAGMMPRRAPRLLEAAYAQNAVNAELFSGELRAFRDLRATATPSKAGVKRTIYRFGQDVADEVMVLQLPGVAGNHASTPDSVVLNITGDITLVAKFAPDSWGTGAAKNLIAKRAPGYRLYVHPVTRVPTLNWHEDALTQKSAAATVGLPNNTDPVWVKATLDVDNGAGGWTARFYTSSDGVTWTQLGTDVTGSPVTVIATNNLPCLLGQNVPGGTEVFPGKIYYAEIRNGIDGTVVAKFDPDNDATAGASSFVSSTGETWTINQSGSPAAEIRAETRFWFHWTVDVDVVRGPINNDTAERTYWTGEAEPRVTDNSLALTGGTDYPMNWYKLGIPKPAASPGLATNGAGSGDPFEIAAVYTYVSAWGEEGPPSDPSPVLAVKNGDTITVSGMAVGPGSGYNIVAKRIYIGFSGNTAADYQFFKEVALATVNDSSEFQSENLAEVIRSRTWTPPPSGLKGLISVANTYLAGFENNDVWLSEANLPHAWPARYRKSCEFKVVGLGSFEKALVALTNGTPQAGVASDPASLVLGKVGNGKACVAKRGIVSLPHGVVYPCADGLGYISAVGWQLVSDAYFTKREWEALNPASFNAYRWGERYVAFYDNGTEQRGFIFSPSDPRAGLVYIDVYATAGYVDPQRENLYLQIGDDIKQWDAAGTLQYTWKSKLFTMPRPINPGFAQVIATTYPVTFKLYADGALKATKSVTSAEPFRLPMGYKAREFEVQLEGAVDVKGVAVAESMADLKQLVT